MYNMYSYLFSISYEISTNTNGTTWKTELYPPGRGVAINIVIWPNFVGFLLFVLFFVFLVQPILFIVLATMVGANGHGCVFHVAVKCFF